MPESIRRLTAAAAAMTTAAIGTFACASPPPPTSERDTVAVAPRSAAPAEDPDRSTGGGGLPSGLLARTDRPDARIADAKYVARGSDRWEVTTGPAHVLWAPGDTASGVYTAATTIEQLEAPTHPEAFGLIVGGRDLDQPSQTYTYLIVRGTGEYMVRVREGAATRTVVPWTANPVIPQQDARGRATYRLAIRAGADSVRFLVNGTAVGAAARSAVPADGIVGLRINHNLRVAADRVRIGP